MLDFLTLALGILLVMAVLQLRAVLSRAFPVVRLRLVPASAPAGAAELFSDAHERLLELGFEGPLWVLNDTVPAEMNMVPLQGVYRHPVERAAIWLAAPVDASSPHRLLSYWTTALSDGRLLVTQAFDPYFSALADDRLLAQCVAAESLREQWTLHQQWSTGIAAGAERCELNEAGLLASGELATNAHRARMLERGLLDVGDNGIARPGFRLAARMLWHYWRRPKSRMAPAPVPVLRLAMLARVVDLMKHREPTQRAQWLLFLSSLVVFVALGAIFWDMRIAVVLLAVIAFHEFGHFMAMRLFGYRQVHMLALPLIGGVTMGVETDPSASKRAWMSLMGPLPGIVLGWILFAWQIQSPPTNAVAADWLSTAVWVCLFINYLNLLPVPPLDGGHVVQAMLPPRWINAQAVFVLLACAIGAVAAWFLDFKLLVFLALLQFLGAFQQFAVGRAIRTLLNEETTFKIKPRPLRIARALSALESTAGTTMLAAPRINQALQIVQVLETRPMGWGQRLLIGSVFSALLIVPVLGLMNMLISSVPSMRDVDWEAKAARDQAERATLLRDAETRSTADLLSDLAAGSTASVAPASIESIAAAESRLGRPLPQTLRELYQLRNGIEWLSVDPIEAIDLASRRNADALAAMVDAGGIPVWNVDADAATDVAQIREPDQVPLQLAGTWIDVGNPDSDGTMIFVESHRADAEARVISCYEGCEAYASVRAWLNQAWVSERLTRQAAQQLEAAQKQAKQTLAQARVAELMQHFEAPSLLLRWLGGGDIWPAAATSDQISATEQRLGRSLPQDLIEIYAMHDGFPALRLAPLAGIQAFAQAPDVLGALPTLVDAGDEHANWNRLLADIGLEQCFVIGGIDPNEDPSAEWKLSAARSALLWCPNSHQAEIQVLDLLMQESHASIVDYVRHKAANTLAQKTVWDNEIK
jgi:Zn-dependent protease/cell wall assembly regulator SMI1